MMIPAWARSVITENVADVSKPYLNDEEYDRILRIEMRRVSMIQDTGLWSYSIRACGSAGCARNGFGDHLGERSGSHFIRVLGRARKID